MKQLVPVVDGVVTEVLLENFALKAQIATKAIEQSVLEDYRKVKRPRTIRRQQSEIELFEKFLAEWEIPLTGFKDDLSLWSGMNRGMILVFRKWLENHKYRYGSINLCISTLRVYSGLAYAAKYIDENTWGQIEAIHNITKNEASNIDERRGSESIGLKKAKATPITPAQLISMKRKLREDKTPASTRDLLILCLLADHGMRVSEVASLRYKNVDIEQARFLINRSKTYLEHFHKFFPDTLEAMQAFLECYPREPDEALIGIKVARIRQRINALGKRIKVNLSPHDLRHYFATYAEGNLLDIAKAGGWKTLNMILYYRLDLENANENITMPNERTI